MAQLAQALKVELSGLGADTLGGEAVRCPLMVEEASHEQSEGSLELPSILVAEEFLQLVGADVALVVDLEGVYPAVELPDVYRDLLLLQDLTQQALVGAVFDQVAEEDAQEVGEHVAVVLLHHSPSHRTFQLLFPFFFIFCFSSPSLFDDEILHLLRLRLGCFWGFGLY